MAGESPVKSPANFPGRVQPETRPRRPETFRERAIDIFTHTHTQTNFQLNSDEFRVSAVVPGKRRTIQTAVPMGTTKDFRRCETITNACSAFSTTAVNHARISSVIGVTLPVRVLELRVEKKIHVITTYEMILRGRGEKNS